MEKPKSPWKGIVETNKKRSSQKNIMKFYISDLHFGHRNVISFDHRPFADREEMDRFLIELWNGRVNNDDEVYVIGDFAYRNHEDEVWYLKQLKGRKHLVVGNHDRRLLANERAMKYFETVDKIMGITDLVEGRKTDIVLCHYPMAEWYKSGYGSWHIFGHIHGDVGRTARYMAGLEHTLNAAAVVNHYTPANMEELIRNNEAFRKKYLREREI